MIEPIALPRGAALLAETAEGARSFAAGLWFRLGSRHEAPHERGFAHFTEHMIFKGSETRSALDIARAADRVGGWLNAFTERDCLCVHCVVPAAYWRLALELLVDMTFRATFPEEEFERERGVIRSEILAARDDPEESSHDAFLERIWSGHPLGRTIAGEPEDIDAISREALYAFYRARLRPELLVASVAGPLSAAEVAYELARSLDALPSFPAASAAPPVPETTPVFHAVDEFLEASASQVYLYEALQLDPPFALSDYYTLSTLNGAIGESMSSRLFQRLRERLGLCYSVYSGFSLGRSEGLWLASASCAPRDFPRLLAALDEELDKIARSCGNALFADEVAESVSRIEGSYELSLDDPEYGMRRLARQYLYLDEVLDVEETRARILAVRPADVNAMAERLFAGKVRARFAYGRPTKAGSRLLQGGAKGVGGG